MNGQVERAVVKGFIVQANIADVGVASGALDKVDNAYLAVNSLAPRINSSENWRGFEIDPLEVVPAFDRRSSPDMPALSRMKGLRAYLQESALLEAKCSTYGRALGGENGRL